MESPAAPGPLPTTDDPVSSSGRGIDWRHEWPGLLGVIAIVVVLGWPQLRPGTTVPGDFLTGIAPWDTIVPGPPANALLGDPILVLHPFRQFVNRELQQGRFPLWNPYIFAGQPAVADPDMALFYPATLALAWLTPGEAFDAHILIHLLVAALGMYVLGRVWGAGRLGAVVGAAVFCGSSALALLRYHGNLPAVGAWLPWLLVAFETSLRQRAAAGIAAGGFVLGLIFTANFLQWALYDLFLLGTYAAWLTTWRFARREAGPFRPLAYAAAIVAIGLALGAVQLLPLAELASFSPRSAPRTFRMLRDLTLPPGSLVTALAPDFFGTPTRPGSWWGPDNYIENTIYLGVVPLAVALTLPVWRRSRRVGFFWLFLLFAASIMVGLPTLHLFAWLPGFNLFAHNRLGYLVCFCGAALCALGIEPLGDRRSRRPAVAVGVVILVAWVALTVAARVVPPADRLAIAADAWRWTTWLAAPALAVFLAGAFSPGVRRGTPLLLAGLIAVDLASFSLAFAPRPADERTLFPVPRVLDKVERWLVPTRVAPLPTHGDPLFTPNSLMALGLAELGGYSSLSRDDVRRFIRMIEGDSPAGLILAIESPDSPLLDLAGVEYFVTRHPLDTDAGRLELLGTADGLRLYRNRRAAPRAFIVERVRRADTRQARRLLAAGGFAYCRAAVVEATPGTAPAEADDTPWLSIPERCQGSTVIVEYDTDHVEIQVETPSPGMLVLTDAFYPGWTATVDGVPQAIHRADWMFRGVFVEAGEHRVEFRYRPTSLRLGGGISVAGLAAAGGLFVVGRRRRVLDRGLPTASSEPTSS